MKIGPLTLQAPVKLASNGTKPPPLSGELGATGTSIFGGLLTQQDYAADLQTPNAYDVYDKMRLGDGQVKAALTVIKLPLLNADWYIEPATDKAEDREIAEFLQRDLMEEMTISWRDYFRQVLLHLDYGSMPFEKVWAVRDGMVHLRKLAPRLPKTVLYWLVDETGGLAGIRQGTPTGSGWKLIDIPVEKLLVFVNDLEGSNYKGTSVLRAARTHHYYKDGLYRVQAIALEKRSLGVDKGILKGEGVDEQRKKDLERALMSLHAHEKQFFVAVENQVDYELVSGGAGRLLDPQGAIDHHDVHILRSLIAEFLAMGTGSTGSLAMHRDKTSLLMLGLGGIANYIVDTHNKHLIRQWVDYNWSVNEYPRLRYARLEARDIGVFADAILKLFQAGSITPTPEVEAEARSLLDLPPRPPGSGPDEQDKDDIDEMPTEEAVAAIRTLRRLLKRRREEVAA